MRNGRRNQPFRLDAYRTRAGRAIQLHKSETIYAKKSFSTICIAAFVCIDLFCLKTVWNLVQTENPIYVWLVAFACAAALDVPMAIAAIAVKRYKQGLSDKKEKNLILILSVTVFVIAFIFSLGFRIITGDLSFDIHTDATLINSVSMEPETNQITYTNPAVLYAAAFNGVIPLLTSLSSFIISYFSTSPMIEKSMKIEKERIGIQTNIIEAEKAIAECADIETHCECLIAREKDLYKEFIDQLDAEAITVKQTARVIQMEKLASAENITSITDASKKLEEAKPAVNGLQNELLNLMTAKTKTKDAKVIELNNCKTSKKEAAK